jgi:hypothetical protein
MTFTIEGEAALTGFNPAEEAGGTNTGIVKEFDVTVSDGNGLRIEADKGDGDDVFVCGIEIAASAGGTQPVTLTMQSPSAGETYAVGDVLEIVWSASDNFTGGVFMSISFNSGRDWISLLEDPIGSNSSDFGSFAWTIQQINGQSPVSENVMVKIADYNDASINAQTGVFSILDSTPIANGLAQRGIAEPLALSARNGVLRASISTDESFTISVFALNGRQVARLHGRGADYAAPLPLLEGNGVYIVRARIGSRQLMRQISLH